MTNDKKEDVKIDKLYGHFCKMPKEEFISKFNVKDEGLNENEVSQKLHTYGYNEVTRKKAKKVVLLSF